jgi:hypothetical protein
LNARERYSTIARKYDAYREYMKGLRAGHGARRAGPSVLDDLETIASDPSGQAQEIIIRIG